MGNAIATVVLLIIFIIYAVFFAVWNPDVVSVTGFSWAGTNYGLPVPIFILPLAGLLLGAIVMAIAMISPWSSMKRSHGATKQQLDTERSRSKRRGQKIQALQKRINELETRAQEAEPAASSEASSEPDEEA
jgi:uncharacterized integral membrane protein